MNVNDPNTENSYNIDIVKLSYLTDEEKNVIEIMKKGELLVGTEKTIDGINAWIDMCLKNRIIYN